jgi:lipoprotein-anchoring transpeptidase ErfK/SrfK
MRPRAVVTAALALVVLAAAALAGLAASAALSGGEAGPRLSSLPRAPGGASAFDPAALRAQPGRRAGVIATARGAAIRVHARPTAGARTRTLRARRVGGRRIPLTFLVVERRGGWVRARLPTRPNLSTGWLRAAGVRFAATEYRVRVQLRRHRLLLLRGAKVLLRAPIGTGRAVSPTPTGTYFVTDLLRPPDPGGVYGPYALGLSAHSPVYTSFAGGDGQVGLHGTNRPGALGRDVSHGCIRVANAVITRLARLVPLGTPVEISRA